MVQGGGFEPPKLARQIYSLIPLATREPLPKKRDIVRLTPSRVNRFANTTPGQKLGCPPYKKLELARGIEPPTG